MRGSVFYNSSRLSALETSINFNRHKKNLSAIRGRTHSTMCRYFCQFYWFSEGARCQETITFP
jgi:hypothetical protein